MEALDVMEVKRALSFHFMLHRVGAAVIVSFFSTD